MLPNRLFFIFTFLLCGAAATLFAQPVEIWEIQGADDSSPYLGLFVTTQNNVVTATGNGFFFLQTPAQRSDNDPSTSDGLFVFTGFDHGLSPGQLVNVSGRVDEFGGTTELAGVGLQVIATGQTAALPPPVALSLNLPSPIPAAVYDLERVEGMRVTFTANVVGPSQGGGSEAALSLANGRPFREPGIAFPGLMGLPVWDGNPEIFWFDPDVLNQPDNRFISVGQQVTATAIVYQRGVGSYTTFPTTYTVSGTRVERDARPPASDEFTVGSFNAFRLDADSDNLSVKYQKTARYIVDRLGAPDVVALQEVGDLNILNDLAAAIRTYRPAIEYTAYLLPGNNNTFFNSAFLVRTRLRNVAVTQLGKDENLSTGGRLHDRPPLLLSAVLPTEPPVAIQVLNLHLRSFNGIEDGSFVKRKRYEQALSVARMVQERQADNLLVVGDFNAFPFTDGYVDVLGIIQGVSGGDAEYPGASIVSPPLRNYSFEADAAERYSYVFEGSAQLIDHCLANNLSSTLRVSDFAFARGNADAASAFSSNPVLSTRTSDHDGFVLYLATDATIVSTEQPSPSVVAWPLPNPVRAGTRIPLPSMAADAVQLFAVNGQRVAYWQHPTDALLLPNLPSGSYFLRWEQGAQTIVRPLVVE